MAQYLPLAAAAIIAVLATIHLVYTLSDMFGQPRYFAPRDTALLEAMRATQLRLAPAGRDYWTALLGFHLMHCLALVLFALLIVLAVVTPLPALLGFHLMHCLALALFALLIVLSVLTPLPALRPFLIGVALLLTLIAWRFWFHVPAIGCAVVSALLIAGWVF